MNAVQWRDDDGVLWEATLIGKRGDNLCVTKPKRVPDKWCYRVKLSLAAASMRLMSTPYSIMVANDRKANMKWKQA